METRTVEQVKSWNTRSFADGYAGLRELSDGEFSGAVRAGGAWLFMLNGRIIGVYEGSLDDFEDADGTAYAAPHPSLPLLFSMQERGGETQAKYYTNKTPLSEVDSTLTSGNFTGYIELSENVLSGDYYVAYYGGRSMSVAFVGASEQVVTGEDAFERANDEVGIYEVRDVSIDVTDVPEPEEPGPEEPEPEEPGAAGGASGGNDASDAGASGVGAGASSSDSSAGAGGTTSNDVPNGAANDASPDDAAGGAGGTTSGRAAETQSAASHVEAAEPSAETDQSRTAGADPDSEPARSDVETETTDRATRATDASVRATETDAGTQTEADASAHTDANTPSDAGEREGANGPATADGRPNASRSPSASTPGEDSSRVASDASTESTAESADESDEDASGSFADEEEWRETTTIPSLDPDRSEGPDGAAGESAAGASGEASSRADRPSAKSAPESRSDDRATTDRASRGRSTERSRSGAAESEQSRSGAAGQSANASETGGASSGTTSGNGATGTGGTAGTGGTSGPSATGGSQASGSGDVGERAKERIQKLRSQLKQRKQQVEQLKSRLSDVESERNEYKRERDALRQEVERLEAKLESAGSGASGSAKRQLDRAQAFDGTNLFVRYESKGKATLDEAAEGKVEASDVNANLRLEHHTQFEAEDVEVAGESFESFLTDSFEYRFVSWIIEELLYEVRDTGHRTSLKDLYESIPKIDRVDLHGSVSAGSGDDDTRQESFDIIMRDRMGNPLVVADLNDSRDPTTGEMMGSLVDAASGVAGTHDELSGAFQVTESFFEPEALETTESATSGGFLSREKRESFVKLSRKRGYHLCLVESRSGGFHLNVPEL
ncbi:hypothetical protein M0R88_15265 [Halorussus gelatinilyticus]|uniref:DUF7527 domain-containing protein n=1 Tax=Halorussus gelatinilyticus TaxID=2937524 RepID=A0A8U0IGP7_9EURY|nr:hypothetical protein [Halorussus gelatinilyticus]UPV99865.1 hypothetical protein M0R88_15265 [Halorussus gelatinilyticus]